MWTLLSAQEHIETDDFKQLTEAMLEKMRRGEERRIKKAQGFRGLDKGDRKNGRLKTKSKRDKIRERWRRTVVEEEGLWEGGLSEEE